ncbi:Sugar phosphate isomerase/epimerase [Sphingobium faniae]|nr:Sugar phosphate isomerase/epimerase [Sphingobium faniae]
MDIALHQVTALDIGPLELVDMAADNGCARVCIFTNAPALPTEDGGVDLGFPMVTRTLLPAFQAKLAERGLAVGNIEFFPLDIDPPFEQYREGLAIGGELGAVRAVVHMFDPDLDRGAASLARFAAMAAEYGLDVGIEFMPLSPACPTAGRAADYIRASGDGNVRIGVDALHLARSGGSPADIAAMDPSMIGYCQLCDGPLGVKSDYLAEALDRKVPGTGDFPLVEMIRVLPLHTDFDIETPLLGLANAGVSAVERVRKAVEGARRVMQEGGR